MSKWVQCLSKWMQDLHTVLVQVAAVLVQVDADIFDGEYTVQLWLYATSVHDCFYRYKGGYREREHTHVCVFQPY